MYSYDPHSHNMNVHYRLYDSPRNGPTVICVQGFDYPDYNPVRFMSPEAYDSDDEARRALADEIVRRQTVHVPLPTAEELSSVIETVLSSLGIWQNVSDHVAAAVVAYLQREATS